MNDISVVCGHINRNSLNLSLSFGGRFFDIKLTRQNGKVVGENNRFAEIMLELGYQPIQIIVLTDFITELVDWIEAIDSSNENDLEVTKLSVTSEVSMAVIKYRDMFHSIEIRQNSEGNFHVMSTTMPKDDLIDWLVDELIELMKYA